MTATPVVQGEPVAWRYTDSRGHFRYRGAPWLNVAEYTYLKPEPLYAAPAPSPKETV